MGEPKNRTARKQGRHKKVRTNRPNLNQPRKATRAKVGRRAWQVGWGHKGIRLQ